MNLIVPRGDYIVLKLAMSVIGFISALVFSGSSFACCKYGCCDCSCVARTPEEIKSKSSKVAADLNKVLRKHKVGGYVSDFKITTADKPDSLRAPLYAPKGCKYVCVEETEALACKVDCK